MSDAMKQAEAIGTVVSKPKAYWPRQQDATANDESVNVPVYVGIVACVLTELLLVLAGNYNGSPSGAVITVTQWRGVSTIDTFTSPFQASWANKTTVIDTPNWDLEPDDVITVDISKPTGVILPSLLFRLKTEP